MTPDGIAELVTAGDLYALTGALERLGAEARCDDRDGPGWSAWADWCWAQSLTALPASSATGASFLREASEGLDTDELLSIIEAVDRRHACAAHPSPFDTSVGSA